MTNPEDKHIDWVDVMITILLTIAFIVLAFTVIAKVMNLNDIPVHETTVSTTSITEPEETIHIEPTETVCEAIEPPVTTVCVPDVDPIERELMAIVVYQEAGGDAHCDDCRRRVADVVLNRVADARFPDSIEGVLTEYRQYGLLWKTGVQWQDRADDPDEWHAVNRAYDIAEEVLKGNHSELYGNGYVYQAEFKQGRDGFWCCGTYFGR